MGRPKRYDKRFHFHGPVELDIRAREFAERRTVAGSATTPSEVMRQALAIGLDTLESGAHVAHETRVPGASPLRAFDLAAVLDAVEVVETLVDLGGVLRHLDGEAIRALGHLDVDAVRALGRLDVDVIDAIAALDVRALAELEHVDVASVARLAEAAASAGDAR